MNKVNINAIIQHLSNKIQSSTEDIPDLKNAKILGELPLGENSEKLVLVVSLLETVVDTEVSKIALVRCSLFGNSVNYTDAKLITNMERITQLLVNDYSVSVPNFGFGCYKITEVGLSPPMMDDKKRNIRTKDFYLYYLL